MFSGRKRNMSSPIIPIEGPLGPHTATTTTAVAADAAVCVGTLASELAAGETQLAIIASRGGPPPEVLDQIATAATIEEQLRETGQQLRFGATDAGRTRIELQDRDGNTLRSVSTAEAFELAAGKPLE
jgi:hypothetical protein